MTPIVYVRVPNQGRAVIERSRTCPNCFGEFAVTATNKAGLAYVWQLAPAKQVLGLLCPACAEALAAQIQIDNTAAFGTGAHRGATAG